MTVPRARRWLGLPSLTGGLVLFAVEALVVLALAGVAWVVAVVVAEIF